MAKTKHKPKPKVTEAKKGVERRTSNIINADIHQRVQNAFEQIKKLKPEIFGDLDTVMPAEASKDSDLEVGTFQSPYRVKEHQEVLKQQQTGEEVGYNCAVPLSMISLTYTPIAGVRISPGAIRKIMKERYAFPNAVRTIHIFVRTGEDVLSSRELNAGSFEEDRIAFWLRLEERCNDPLTTDDELWQWRKFANCCSCQLILMDNDQKRFFKGIQLRREIVRAGSQARRSATQITQEILSLWTEFAKEGEKPTIEKIMKMYADNCGDEDSTDQEQDPNLNMTKTAITQALAIQKTILDDEQLMSIVNNCEDVLNDRSPFFNMSNLHLISMRAKADKDDAIWTMVMLSDYAKMDPSQTWTFRQLSPRNSKGMMDVFSFKRKVKDLLLGHLDNLPSKKIAQADKAKLQQCLQSVDA